MVTGGSLDGDLGIYLFQGYGSQTGTLIGTAPVETSFYNSDKNGGTWMDKWGWNQRIINDGNPLPHPGYIFIKVFLETMKFLSL